jgi:hypothetical protein
MRKEPRGKGRKPPPGKERIMATSGVQLLPAPTWNAVIYGGPSQSLSKAIASIQQYVIRIWVYRNGEWLMYDPADLPGSNLTYLYNGESVNIQVSEACFWSWEVVGAAQFQNLVATYN